MKKQELRIEKDRFGEISLSASAYWGAQTARACENGVKLSALNPKFLDALLLLNKAAALANAETGTLDIAIARAVGHAVDETMSGQWQDQFVLSPMQIASVYDLIANVQEVLANRAGEILGSQIGSYSMVHPHKHLGLGRSAADDFATALRVSLLFLHKDLESSLRDLERLLRRKALECERLAKNGQNNLAELHSTGLGQIFNGFGFEVGEVCRRISQSCSNLLELNLSTGHDTAPGAMRQKQQRLQLVVDKLSSYTGMKFRLPDDPIASVKQSINDFVELSSSLKLLAITLNRIANELRSMAAGPWQGFVDIKLPAAHYGLPSEISADTAKPVVIEFVNMVAFQVIGMDASNSLVAQSRQEEANGMLALVAHNLLHSMDLLRQTVVIFNKRCINGIDAKAQHALSGQSADFPVSV